MYGEDELDFDYESIDDIARGEGFYIDEDNHWVPLPDDDEFYD